MSIPDTISFDKEGRPLKNQTLRRVFLPVVVLLVALLGYGLGKLRGAGEHQGVTIKYDENIIPHSSAPNPIAASTSTAQFGTQTAASSQTSTSVYASSKGTRYYYSSCKSSVSRANKITFATAALAESAGYTLATTCRK